MTHACPQLARVHPRCGDDPRDGLQAGAPGAPRPAPRTPHRRRGAPHHRHTPGIR